MKFSDLQSKQQQQIIQSVAIASQLDAQSVEKDWWVTQVLKAIFSLPYNRMTRHLYDLYCMKHAGVVDRTLSDEALYRAIVEHRRKFINLRDFDYDTLYPKHLSLDIPANVLDLWRKDYETMQRTMIYGQSVTFDELLAEIRQLNRCISELPYQK
jgi:hypothetical protein